MSAAAAAAWGLTRAVLVLVACVYVLGGEWPVGGLALGLLALARWLRGRPPAHVREALASSAGLTLRRSVLEVFFPEVARVAHLVGVPQEAVGVLLVEVGQALQRGRVGELLEELQRDRAAHRAELLAPLVPEGAPEACHRGQHEPDMATAASAWVWCLHCSAPLERSTVTAAPRREGAGHG